MAIPLLWYDREEGLFHSAASEVLVSLDAPEKLRKAITFYEEALRPTPVQERILCQRELCRCILRQAGVWLMEQGLDQESLFRLFTQIIRQYLWGDLHLLQDQEDTDRDNLIPPLILRLSGALDKQEIPVPSVLLRLLRLCIAVAMGFSGPFPFWAMEEDGTE